jgi:hypothetical protein
MNRIFAILIMCFLLLPVYAYDEQEGVNTTYGTTNPEEIAPDINNVETKSLSEEQEALTPVPQQETSSTYKQPFSKKKLAKKFIIAMLCVAGTSVFLYITLSAYNKIRDGFVTTTTNSVEGEKLLDTPQDLTEAVKTFIDKTHWNG